MLDPLSRDANEFFATLAAFVTFLPAAIFAAIVMAIMPWERDQ